MAAPRSIVVATAADDDNEAAADSPLTLGNQHPRAHIIMFVLGVLPQAIKLFGMRGIPWTQACGGLYLSSFLVIAGVGALGQRAERNTDADTSREGALDEQMMKVWNFASIWVVAVVQAGVWVWCMRALLHPAWHIRPNSSTLCMILWFLACMVFAIVTWTLNMLAVFSLFVTPLIPTIIGKIVYFAVSASLVIGVPLYGTPYLWTIFISGADYLLFSLYVLLAAFVATKVVPHRLLMLFFGLVNLVLSILYYRFRYDPTGTVKPIWAGKLG